MKIYLLNETRFEGVENLILNELVFYDFSVDLSKYDALICTSKNALKALQKANIALDLDINLYVVGQNTAEFAQSLGFKNVKFPKESYAQELLETFKEELKGKKCLCLRAKNIAHALQWQNKDIYFDEIIVYENVFKEGDKNLSHPAIFIFTSPLSVENFLKFYSLEKEDKAVAIGKSTAKKLFHFKNLFICKNQSLKECVELAKNLSIER